MAETGEMQVLSRRGPRALLLLFVVLLPITCVVVPQGRWDPDHGPVLPHDSFPSDCSLCHLPGSWNRIRDDFSYDHEKETGVPLSGAHASATCLRCHNDRGPVQLFAQRGCAGCHDDVHRGKLGRACTDCHDEASWRPREQIARHRRTRFPLVGAHAAAACFRCHPGAQVGNFEGAPIDCAACHQPALRRATSPDHAAQGWTASCERCHVPLDWSLARFAHPAAFPLSGAHRTECAACHGTGAFKRVARECDSCHAAEYESVRQPDHRVSGFSRSCEGCHSTLAWRPARYTSHPATFPLRGAHAAARCDDCHTVPGYRGLQTSCASCHRRDYDTSTNPRHGAAQLALDCTRCHTDVAWQPARYTHPPPFTLTGAHSGRKCSECHTGTVYKGLPGRCADCHTAAYNATTSPNHRSASFPTTCETCHTTTRWTPASFSHTFPRTGHHALSCVSCHTTPNNYNTFSCIDCHEHNQAETTKEHKDVAGFRWVSSACVSCHPQGR